jgi:hypothetical protein
MWCARVGAYIRGFGTPWWLVLSRQRRAFWHPGLQIFFLVFFTSFSPRVIFSAAFHLGKT